MASLEEAIALDIARKRQAGINARQIAREILTMNEIAEGLELRREHMRKQAGRGLAHATREFVASYDLKEPDESRQMIGFYAYDEADAHQRIELMRESLVYEGPAEKMRPRG